MIYIRILYFTEIEKESIVRLTLIVAQIYNEQEGLSLPAQKVVTPALSFPGGTLILCLLSLHKYSYTPNSFPLPQLSLRRLVFFENAVLLSVIGRTAFCHVVLPCL